MNQENNLSSLRKVESWLPVKVCAWCGFRPPEDALEVALHRWKFYAPICPECELFAEKLQANQRKLWRIIVAFCFGLALIPAYFIALDELVIGIISWPIFGILILGFLTFPLNLQWLSRLGVREQPPQGYACWPCSRNMGFDALLQSLTLNFLPSPTGRGARGEGEAVTNFLR